MAGFGRYSFDWAVFRQSSKSRDKRELVILVTLRIIDDTVADNYGYGYTPNFPAARQVMSGS